MWNQHHRQQTNDTMMSYYDVAFVSVLCKTETVTFVYKKHHLDSQILIPDTIKLTLTQTQNNTSSTNSDSNSDVFTHIEMPIQVERRKHCIIDVWPAEGDIHSIWQLFTGYLQPLITFTSEPRCFRHHQTLCPRVMLWEFSEHQSANNSDLPRQNWQITRLLVARRESP